MKQITHYQVIDACSGDYVPLCESAALQKFASRAIQRQTERICWPATFKLHGVPHDRFRHNCIIDDPDGGGRAYCFDRTDGVTDVPEEVAFVRGTLRGLKTLRRAVYSRLVSMPVDELVLIVQVGYAVTVVPSSRSVEEFFDDRVCTDKDRAQQIRVLFEGRARELKVYEDQILRSWTADSFLGLHDWSIADNRLHD